MIVGSTLPNLDAVIPVLLHAKSASPIQINAIIDTGFTEWIALPRPILQSCSSGLVEEDVYVLADGSKTLIKSYKVAVEWFDQLRHVMAIEVDGAPLIGMAMLRGSRLTIDVVNGGKVTVESIAKLPQD